MTDIVPVARINDVMLVKLARELAMDIHPLEDILKAHGIEPKQWGYIQDMPRFQALLETETAQWNGALNTQERVKIKASAMIEEWLPEAHERMHDRGESLNAKTELGKLIRDLAGFSKNGVGVEGSGERFSVTINLGADASLKFEKQLPPMVIDAEAE
jgi:hypothetical protein